MKGIHPKSGIAAATMLSALVAGACGCSHNGASASNPFLAPTRVPPPSTRMVAPGTAQPYYQGDPLPVMQSAAPVPPAAAPNALAAASAAPVATTMTAASADEPKTFVFSNEPTVAIPSDGNSLRFELPPPPEPPVMEAAATPTIAAAQSVASPPTIAATAQSAVVPAIYNAPAITTQQPAVSGVLAVEPAEPRTSGPWRSPQVITTPAAPAVYGSPPAASPVSVPPLIMPGYTVIPPTAAAQPAMDVQLRPMPSPPADESPAPRIRLPGYRARPVSMTAVPATATSSGSMDGFRPRSSMR